MITKNPCKISSHIFTWVISFLQNWQVKKSNKYYPLAPSGERAKVAEDIWKEYSELLETFEHPQKWIMYWYYTLAIPSSMFAAISLFLGKTNKLEAWNGFVATPLVFVLLVIAIALLCRIIQTYRIYSNAIEHIKYLHRQEKRRDQTSASAAITITPSSQSLADILSDSAREKAKIRESNKDTRSSK